MSPPQSLNSADLPEPDRPDKEIRCPVAAVLAGGRSRRMGRDKALIEVESGTLLDQAVDLVRPLAVRVMVIGRRIGETRLGPVEGHLDAYPNAGPLGGIATALELSRPEPCLIVPCDMPMLKRDLLRRLLRLHALEDSDCTLAVSPVRERPEPLVGVYEARCLQPMTEAIAAGRLAVWQTLNHVTVSRLTVSPAEANQLTNVNTPEDLSQMET